MRFILQGGASDDKRLVYIGKRPETPEEAWGITLEKWGILSGLDRFVFDGSGQTCGLCMYYAVGHLCGECPISVVGFDHCNGTPYYEYSHVNYAQARKELMFLLALYAGLQQ